MKKWWIVVATAAVVCGGIALFVGGAEGPVAVDTWQMRTRSVEQTVTCTGVVESRDSLMVTPAAPCVLGEVLVQQGQAVEAGAVLARVDKAATRQAGFVSDAAGALALATMQEEIVAPQSGVVVSVADAGTPLEAATPCVVLAPHSQLQVRIAIREKDLTQLQEGMAVRVSGDGFRRGSYAGRLTDIAATATTTGSGDTVVEGIVTLDEGEADDSLRLGLTAKARVVVTAADEAPVVPYAALMMDEDGQEYVYTVQYGTARRRDVTVVQELAQGALLSDQSLVGQTLVMQPERVTGDGMAVSTGEVFS